MKTHTLITLSAAAGLLASCSTPSPVTTSIVPPTLPGTTDSVTAPTPKTVKKVISTIPVATSIEGEPNMVISPYAPYNKIDVSGYKSGDKVGDPSTVKTDGSTGKSNLRVFLLP